MGFSERLKEVMDEKGYTNYRVAKELNLSATTLSNYLNERTKPDITKLEVINRYLGVNRKWLISGEGEKERLVAEDGKPEEDENTVNRLLNLLEKHTDSIREKDQQISQLINTAELLISKLPPLGNEK